MENPWPKRYKERKDKGLSRIPYGKRTDNKRTSVQLSGELAFQVKLTGRPSYVIQWALARVYGIVPPETVPHARIMELRAAVAPRDPVTVSVSIPKPWWLWCAVERIPMSALVNDALVRVLFLGE